MGFVVDAVSGLFESGADAAESAARRQESSAVEAREIQKTAETEALARSQEAEAKARKDLQPFTEAGTRAIGDLESGLDEVSRLISDPQAQKEFITDNVFFESLTNRATSELFSNQAARGKVGSGGTAEALQESILLLGSDLLNQNITQRQNQNAQFQNLVNTGVGTATNQANVTQTAAGRDISTLTGVANQRSDLTLQKGNAQAAGIMGARNAEVGALNTTLEAGAAVANFFTGGNVEAPHLAEGKSQKLKLAGDTELQA